MVYYGFMCRPVVRTLHLLGCLVVCGSAVGINYIPKLRGPEYRAIRAGGFILTGAYGLFPLSHLLYVYGLQDGVCALALKNVVSWLMAVLWRSNRLLWGILSFTFPCCVR
jgi:predicted membrane channel-forming protein YqfA (hemolysin III family)